MPGLLRIHGPSASTRDAERFAAASAAPPPESGYGERLLKLVPAEVVAFYTYCAQLFDPLEWGWHLLLVVLGLALLFAIRMNATSDPARSQGPQWNAIILAAVAFLIWTYHLGGPFRGWGLHHDALGMVLVAFWSLFVPAIYKGD